MTRKTKKIISVLLSVVLLFGIVPMGMFSANALTEGSLMYSINENNEAQIIGCDLNASGDIVIPAILGDCPVTKISLYSFSSCEKITSVTIPDSVAEIGHYAFADCTALKSVKIGAGVTTLGNSVFLNSLALEKIEVSADNSVFTSDEIGVLYNKAKTELLVYPASNPATIYTVAEDVKKIADSTFMGSNYVKTIVMGDNVTTIGANAFLGGRSLETIVIGKGVTLIGSDAFEGCAKLTGINVGAENTVYCSDENGVLYNKSKTQILKYPAGNARTAFAIPQGIAELSVLSFSNAVNLKTVTITKDVKNIGASAFYGCNNITDVIYGGSEAEWKAVTVGSNNNAILGAKFTYAGGEEHGHSYTSSITKAASCTENGTMTFSCSCGQSYTEVIPATGHAFENNVCKNCNKKEFVFTEDGTNAKITAYNGVGGALVIPEKIEGYTVNAIGDSAFENNTAITSVVIPDSVRDIGSCAFFKTGFYNNTANWENGILYSGKFLLEANDSVKGKYTVKDTTKVIADYAFSSRASLEEITLPKSLEIIGDSAFSNCTALKKVTTGLTEDEWKNVVIGIGNDALTSAEITYYVPPHVHAFVVIEDRAASCTEASYKLEKCACGDTREESLPALGHNFVNNVCSRCKIREYDITISSATGVTIHGCNNALSGVLNIPETISGYSVTKIAANAFKGNTKITKVVIPANVTEIEPFAFTGSKITDIEVSEFNTRFASVDGVLCTKDEKTIIFCPSSKVGEETEITDGVEIIADGAFAGCDQIVTLSVPTSVKSIGADAFKGCDKLKKIVYAGTQTQWRAISIGENNDNIKNAEMTYMDTSDAEIAAELVSKLILQNATAKADGIVITITANSDANIMGVSSKTTKEETVTIGTAGTALTSEEGFYKLAFTDWHKAGNKTETTLACSDNVFVVKFVFPTVNDGHVYSTSQRFEPTCVNDGYTRLTCSICSKYYDTDVVAKLGHSYDLWVIDKDETCTENGIKYRVCKVCSADTEGHVEQGVVLATGHNYESVITPATCLTGGFTTKTCKKCNDSYVTDQVEALGHSYGEWVYSKEPSCLEGGKRSRACTACPYSYEEDVSELGHNLVTTITPPTYTEEGYTTLSCTRCEHSEPGDRVPALAKVVSVKVDDIIMYKDDAIALSVAVETLGDPDFTVAYEVVNPDIAEVDENGVIKGKTKGTTQVKCTVTDENGNVVTDVFNVEIKFTVWQWIKWFFVDVLFAFIKSV